MIRVALIHDWLTGMRGGESVLEAIAELLPNAELFTLLYVPEKITSPITKLKRHTSALQKVPGAEKRYRHFLPLMPSLIESFDLSEFDLVISSSHCVAKGVRKAPHAVHVSYVHAPMRYMWDRYDEYFGPGRASLPVRIAAKTLRKHLQNWDRRVSQSDRIDHLIANSQFIASQIQNHYGRPAQVIYPFADLSRFQIPKHPGSNYLMVTAFAPYKRVDIAIQAFNQMQLPLLIVGSGQDETRLKKIAGPTIQFLGSLTNAEIAELYSQCRAFIFPGVEDFGITVVEALSSGTPVIALQQGGAAEIVTPRTGAFFTTQSVDALVQVVQEFEKNPSRIQEKDCRNRGLEFSKKRFQREFYQAIQDTWIASKKDPSLLEGSVKWLG